MVFPVVGLIIYERALFLAAACRRDGAQRRRGVIVIAAIKAIVECQTSLGRR